MHAFDRRTDRQTDRQTDGQTEISSLYRVCIACSAVKTTVPRLLHWLQNYSKLITDIICQSQSLCIALAVQKRIAECCLQGQARQLSCELSWTRCDREISTWVFCSSKDLMCWASTSEKANWTFVVSLPTYVLLHSPIIRNVYRMAQKWHSLFVCLNFIKY